MIIRDFHEPVESIDDIPSILEAKRHIFIYKYASPRQALNVIYNGPDDVYDVYLMNDSVVHGNGFYVKPGITLHTRNVYRGMSTGLLNADGTINYNAKVTFHQGIYTNRFKNKREDGFNFSSFSLRGLGLNSIEDEFMAEVGSEWVQPFPEFYSIEDQAYRSSKVATNNIIRFGDFAYDYSDVPTYIFRQLVDKRTTISVIEMPNDNSLVDCSAFTKPEPVAMINTNVKYDNGIMCDLGEFKIALMSFFIEVNKACFENEFYDFGINVSVKDALFNIDRSVIKKKHKIALSPKEIRQSYAELEQAIGNAVYKYFDGYDEEYSDMPTKIPFHLIDRLKLWVSEEKIVIAIKNFQFNAGLTNMISTSDANEITQLEVEEGIMSYVEFS